MHPEDFPIIEDVKKDKPDYWSISMSRDNEDLLGGTLIYITDNKEPVVMYDLKGYMIVSKGDRKMRITISDGEWSVPNANGEIIHPDIKASIQLVHGDGNDIYEIYVLTVGKYVSAELLVFRSKADYGSELDKYRTMILGARCAGEYYLEKIQMIFHADYILDTITDPNEDIYLETVSKKDMLNKQEIVLELDKS